MLLSIYPDIRTVKPITRELSWQELCHAFGTHDFALPSKNEAPAYSPAEVAPGATRHKRNVQRVHFGVVDIDKVPLTTIAGLLQQLRADNLSHLFYTTWSHPFHVERGVGCGRLLIPFLEPVEAWEWDSAWQRLHALTYALGDPACKDTGRVYYVPSAPAGTEAQAFVTHHTGHPFSARSGLTVEATPVPAPTLQVGTRDFGVRELQAIKERLKSAKSINGKNLREWVRALLAGEPYAAPGERDNITYKLVAALLDEYPDADPRQLALQFTASLQLMEQEKADAPTVSEVEDKARRHQQSKAEDRLATQHAEQDERKRQIRMAFDLSDREHPYTAQELEAFAASLNCKPSELQQFWIIQKHTSFYILVNGSYRGPFTGAEIEKAAQQYLAPAYSAGIEVYTYDGRGQRVAKDTAELMRDYGTLANDIAIDLTAQCSQYDRRTRILTEAPCPMRVTEAVYSAEVARWLELLGGEQAGKIVDWLALAPDLSRPLAALYLDGKKGLGKSLFAEGVARLWSENGTVALADAMGQFNSHIVRCPVLFADESMPQSYNGSIKTGEIRRFIQARTHNLKRKYLADAQVKGAMRFLIAANNNHMMDTTERLSVNDIEAIVDRVVHIDAADRPEAEHYLNSLSADVREGFVNHDTIAKHMLWLQANHVIADRSRFGVRGERSALHRHLTTASGLRSVLCHWLVAYLLEPRMVDATGALLIRIANRELYVNIRAVVKHWDIYPTGHVTPLVGPLSQALAGISRDKSVQLTAGDGTSRPHYHIVDKDNLVAWAVESHFSTREAIERALQTETPTTRANMKPRP